MASVVAPAMHQRGSRSTRLIRLSAMPVKRADEALNLARIRAARTATFSAVK